MSGPVLDLNGIKNLYAQGVAYVKKKNSSPLFTKEDKYLDYVSSLVNKATDLTTLMSAIWMSNYSKYWSSSFNAPKNVPSDKLLQHTGIQFGYGGQGWYFFSGVAETVTYNLTFFRVEIAPPQVVADAGIDPSEAVRWWVLGGYGTIPAPNSPSVWNSIASELIYMKYTQNSSSTFTLTGSGNNVGATISSSVPMTFNLDLNWKNTSNHTMQIVMNALAPPSPNFLNACQCGFGLGNWYYSYTNMNVQVSVENGKVQTGRGWVDHELIKPGIANNYTMQALQVLTNTSASPGWLWFSIQDDQTGLQYMFSHPFGKQVYADGVKLNQNITADIVNVYKDGATYINPTRTDMDQADLKIQMIETVSVPSLGLNLPSKYNITLPGGKEVVLEIATAPNVYTSTFASYETPAILYDTMQNRIGQGLIEANFYLDNPTLAKRYIIAAGGDPNDSDQYNLVLNTLDGKPSGWQKFLALMIVLIPFWLLLLALVFILHKKSGRSTRIGLAIAFLLIFYGLTYSNPANN